jgi:RHS repeat-associated protein
VRAPNRSCGVAAATVDLRSDVVIDSGDVLLGRDPMGPLGQRLLRHRAAVLELAAQYGITDLRVFGSVARGEEAGTTSHRTRWPNNYRLNRAMASSTGSSKQSYVRGGYLERIDYGHRTGGTPAAQMVFTVDGRCLGSGDQCDELTEDTQENWEDVPFDLICGSSDDCLQQPSPSFFTTKRLNAVTTKVRDGGAYRAVDRWTLAHQFPDPGDDTIEPVLWLRSIEHTGLGHPETTITLPKVKFDPSDDMYNRVDEAGDNGSAMWRPRIVGVHTETGGTITVGYSDPDCAPDDLPADRTNNHRLCFPVYWTPAGEVDPVEEYFHKYVVTSTAASGDVTDQPDPSPVIDTLYTYGTVAWRYDDDPLTDEKYRTWSEFRGFDTVEVKTGDPDENNRLRTKSLYFQGMDGNYQGQGEPDQDATIVDSTGTPFQDHDRYAGYLRETITYDGSTEVSATINTPWKLQTATAGGTDKRKAYLLGTGQVDTRVRATELPGDKRRTQTITSFDSAGFPTKVDDRGDVSTGTDDLCTTTAYTRNTGKHILSTVATTETVSIACTAGIPEPDEVVSSTRTYYDHAGSLTTPPQHGLPTKVQQLITNDPAEDWATSETTYDDFGRPTAVTDPLGRTTSTAYTPAVSGPLTKTTTTSPDPDGSESATPHVSSVNLDPAWGVPVKTTDPGGKVTEASYDALGRLLEVWFADRSQTTQTPNLRYEYRVRDNNVTTVTTKSLIHDETYQTSVVLYDGLLRQRQTQAPSLDRMGPGRVITDNHYDARGLVEMTHSPYYHDAAPGSALFVPLEVPGRTRYVYDRVGRVTDEITDVEQWRTTTSYDGDRVHVLPPAGGTATTTISDARGRTSELRQYRTRTIGGAHDATTYAYTPSGQLAELTDAAGNTWAYGYDLLGRKTSAVDPDTGPTTSVYDDAGQLTKTTDAENDTLAYTYDALGRKTSLRDNSVTGTKRASWTYDTIAKGQLTSTTRHDPTRGNYTTAVTGYDDRYRPLGQSVTLPASEGAIAGTYTLGLTYTRDGQEKTRTYQGIPAAGLPAEIVTTVYDELSMPMDYAGGSGGAYAISARYTPYGELLRVNITPDREDKITYTYADGTRRLVNVHVLRQPGTGIEAGGLANRAYGYDDAGNVTSITETADGVATDRQCFGYDYLRRLTTAWTPDAGCEVAPDKQGLGGPAPYYHGYTYDLTGNRRTETRYAPGGDTTTSYDYPNPGQPQPHAVTEIDVDAPGTGNDRTTEVTYDDAGRTTSEDPDDAAADIYAWDREGRLVSTTTRHGAQTVQASYTYTADGDRLIRREGGTTTAYLPGGVELTLTGTSTVTARRYYAFAGQTVAVRTGDQPAVALVPDTQGTAGIAINPDRTVQRRYQTPFGGSRGGTPAWPGDHTYLDAPTDQTTTGWVHLQAREYSTTHGRFLTVDPLIDLQHPQSLNGYAYALNNPTTFTDPTGLAADPGCGCGGWTPVDPPPGAMPGGAEDTGGIDGPPRPRDYSGPMPDEDRWRQVWQEGIEARIAYLDYTAQDFGYDLEQQLEYALVLCDSIDDLCSSGYLESLFYTSVDDYKTQYVGADFGGVMVGGAGAGIIKRTNGKPANAPARTPSVIRVGELKLPGVPKGVTGTPTTSGKGLEYQIPRGTPELDPKVASIRVMDPVTTGKYRYPNGYVTYMNSGGQTVSPLTGRTLQPSDPLWHIEL